MRSFLSFILCAVLLTSCSKDTFKSSPKLSLKSISTSTVPANSDLEIVLRLSDLEGDFDNSLLFVEKNSNPCSSGNSLDSQLYAFPKDIPKMTYFAGDVILTFSYPIVLKPRCNRTDTATFRFWIKDNAGNVSDTVKTPKIIVLNS